MEFRQLLRTSLRKLQFRLHATNKQLFEIAPREKRLLQLLKHRLLQWLRRDHSAGHFGRIQVEAGTLHAVVPLGTVRRTTTDTYEYLPVS